MNTYEDIAKAIKVLKEVQYTTNYDSPNYKDIEQTITKLCEQLQALAPHV